MLHARITSCQGKALKVQSEPNSDRSTFSTIFLDYELGIEHYTMCQTEKNLGVSLKETGQGSSPTFFSRIFWDRSRAVQ